MPLVFEENVGQALPNVKFLSRGPTHNVAVEPLSATFAIPALPKSGQPSTTSSNSPGVESLRFSVRGGNPGATLKGTDALKARANYFLGDDPAKWKRNVPLFEVVRVGSVYPGIDMVYRSSGKEFEYDFVVSPGVDPRIIDVEITGATDVRLDRLGNLVATTKSRSLTQSRPEIYQQIGGRRRPVNGGFKLSGNSLGFWLGAYDHSRSLVIDPVVAYSSYVGGVYSGGPNVKVDDVGHAWISGQSISQFRDFPPGPDPYDETSSGQDAFVAKIDTTKSGPESLTFYTYLGGGHAEFGGPIDIDGDGVIHLAGSTAKESWTAAFPTTPGAWSTCTRINGTPQGWMAKLSGDGSQLLYSTCIPVQSWSRFGDLAVDSAGFTYLIGDINAGPDFLIKGGFEDQPRGGFLIKLDTTVAGSDSIKYSTFIGAAAGGSGLSSLAVDSGGRAFVTGRSNLAAFPITAGTAFQPSHKGDSDAFLMRVNTDKTGKDSLEYSSFLGGAGGDGANGVAVDELGHVYVAGDTFSTDFPRTVPSGNEKKSGFLAKLDLEAGAAGLKYSILLGGSEFDAAAGVAVRGLDDAYVWGSTSSNDLPVRNEFQGSLGGAPTNEGGDFFVAHLNTATPVSDGIDYLSYLGGESAEFRGVHGDVDSNGNLYVTGLTESTQYPVTRDESNRGFQVERPEGRSGVITKISPVPSITQVAPPDGPVTGGTEIHLTGTDLRFVDAIYFGDSSAVPYERSADGHAAKVRAPQHDVGRVNLIAKIGSVESLPSDATTFVFLPVVTGLSPNGSPTTGGIEVVISGEGLATANTVSFDLNDGATETEVSCPSDNCVVDPSGEEITVKANPSHTEGVVDVLVGVDVGFSQPSAKSKFHYVKPGGLKEATVTGPGEGGSPPETTTSNFVPPSTGGFTSGSPAAQGSSLTSGGPPGQPGVLPVPGSSVSLAPVSNVSTAIAPSTISGTVPQASVVPSPGNVLAPNSGAALAAEQAISEAPRHAMVGRSQTRDAHPFFFPALVLLAGCHVMIRRRPEAPAPAVALGR